MNTYVQIRNAKFNQKLRFGRVFCIHYYSSISAVFDVARFGFRIELKTWADDKRSLKGRYRLLVHFLHYSLIMKNEQNPQHTQLFNVELTHTRICTYNNDIIIINYYYMRISSQITILIYMYLLLDCQYMLHDTRFYSGLFANPNVLIRLGGRAGSI